MATRKPAPFDWQAWFRSFGVWGIGIIGVMVTFYFTTTATLKEHERQFADVKVQFHEFNDTLKKNYEDYAKNQKAEAEARDKTREQLMTLFTGLNTATATTKVQVDAISKQLESVVRKIDDLPQRKKDPQ